MNLPDYAGWQKLAHQFEHQTGAFINGDYVKALSEKTYQTINPATEKVTAEMSACDKADVDVAVKKRRGHPLIKAHGHAWPPVIAASYYKS